MRQNISSLQSLNNPMKCKPSTKDAISTRKDWRCLICYFRSKETLGSVWIHFVDCKEDHEDCVGAHGENFRSSAAMSSR